MQLAVLPGPWRRPSPARSRSPGGARGREHAVPTALPTRDRGSARTGARAAETADRQERKHNPSGETAR